MLLHHSKGGEASILPLRRIDGKDSFIDAELLQKKTWINEIAKEFIKLEKLSYNAIGCLAFESEDNLIYTLDLWWSQRFAVVTSKDGFLNSVLSKCTRLSCRSGSTSARPD